MESFPALALAVLVILSYANSIVIVRASDADPLQDICVADLKSKGNIICLVRLRMYVSWSWVIYIYILFDLNCAVIIIVKGYWFELCTVIVIIGSIVTSYKLNIELNYVLQLLWTGSHVRMPWWLQQTTFGWGALIKQEIRVTSWDSR